MVSVRNNAISYYLSEEDCLFFEWNNPQSLSTTLDRIAEKPGILHPLPRAFRGAAQTIFWTGEKKKYEALLNELKLG